MMKRIILSVLVGSALLCVATAQGQDCSFELTDDGPGSAVKCMPMQVEVVDQPGYAVNAANASLSMIEGRGGVIVLSVSSDELQFRGVETAYAQVGDQTYQIDLTSENPTVLDSGEMLEQKMWEVDSDAFAAIKNADRFGVRLGSVVFDLQPAISQAQEILEILRRVEGE